MDAVETVLLIKQAKDRGLSLSAAITAVGEFRARSGAEAPLAARVSS